MRNLELISKDILIVMNETESLLVKARLKKAYDSIISASDVMNFRHGVDINHLGLNEERVSDRRCNS